MWLATSDRKERKTVWRQERRTAWMYNDMRHWWWLVKLVWLVRIQFYFFQLFEPDAINLVYPLNKGIIVMGRNNEFIFYRSGLLVLKLVLNLVFVNAIDRVRLMAENNAQARIMNNKIVKLTIVWKQIQIFSKFCPSSPPLLLDLLLFQYYLYQLLLLE